MHGPGGTGAPAGPRKMALGWEGCAVPRDNTQWAALLPRPCRVPAVSPPADPPAPRRRQIPALGARARRGAKTPARPAGPRVTELLIKLPVPQALQE